MNKTHEELAEEIENVYVSRDRPVRRSIVAKLILTAITAAVQAEREQRAKVLDKVMLELCRGVLDDAAFRELDVARNLVQAELARLSLNDSPTALSNDA